MLQPPNEIGIGEGELKLKIPGLSDVTIKIGKEITIGEVMELECLLRLERSGDGVCHLLDRAEGS
jgi:hypothetical protein